MTVCKECGRVKLRNGDWVKIDTRDVACFERLKERFCPECYTKAVEEFHRTQAELANKNKKWWQFWK